MRAPSNEKKTEAKVRGSAFIPVIPSGCENGNNYETPWTMASHSSVANLREVVGD
jgi:hypothetical protein